MKCPNCGFEPRSDEDKARSLILSTAYEIDDEYRGKSREELEAIAQAIGEGHPYSFDEAEVRSIVEYSRAVLGVPKRDLAISLMRWIGPPLLLLAIIYWLLFLNG